MIRSKTDTRRTFLRRAAAAVTAIPLASGSRAFGVSGNKGRLVLVAGTRHYHPEESMPRLAQELQRQGFQTKVILPQGDPEENHNGVGLPGLEALAEADVAVFFLRFLTLSDEQFGHLERYLKSGKPVVGLRTSTHAFRYPAGHARAAWNEDFGRNVLGTHYLTHMKRASECHRFEPAKTHPILTGIDGQPFPSPGQLYLTSLEPGCKPLVIGRGETPNEYVISDRFRTRLVSRVESDIVAWTWQNHFGAKVFGTTLGHPRDFAVPQIMRLVVNGIHWAAGADSPAASAEVRTFDLPLEP